MFDFHIHSNHSDGQLTPTAITEMMANQGFSAFSITDHNYLPEESVAIIPELAAELDITFIPGIEISSKDLLTDTSLHILGYGTQMNRIQLNAALTPIREGYNNRAKKIIDKLNSDYTGLKLDFDQLLAESESSYLTRNQLAAALRDFLNDGTTIKELISEVFVNESDNWMPQPDEAIRTIKKCGGLPVLAHPGRLAERDEEAFALLLKRLTEVGLSGIETYYASHTESQTNNLSVLACRFGLIMTGGSDWHGPDFSPDKKPGCPLKDNPFTSIQ
jgi:predicted metal-dependent phosphoesterase TrpH